MMDDLPEVVGHLQAMTVRIRAGRRGRRWATGSGSGVLWRPGVVVTNAHVVEAGSLLVIETAGGAHEARLLARDPRQDLAVLHVEPELQPRSFPSPGPRGAMRIGELVLAIGNPPGLDGAVTTGIVHSLVTPRRGIPLILADLRLVPGNSGGPLGDAAGRVVGVNAMVVRGLAAAIPSDVVERFLERVRLAA